MFLIVLNHAIQLGLDNPIGFGYDPLPVWGRGILTLLQAFGVFAVPVFLFISGSFVAYAAQGTPPRLSSRFLGSSLRHILTPYFIWSVIFYVVVFFVNGETYTPGQYLKNLLVGYPYHFIPLLFFFYISSPIFVWLSRRFAWLLLVVISIYQLIMLNIVYPGVLGFVFPAGMQIISLPVLSQTLADWAIFFPLGLIYGLYTRRLLPELRKLRWALAGFSTILFVIGLLDAFGAVNFPVARHLCAIPLVLLLPTIKRERIPLVQNLEKLGKRSYGLYLTHLVALVLTGFAIKTIALAGLGLPILLFPLLLLGGLAIPWWLMNLASRGRLRAVYRYLFG